MTLITPKPLPEWLLFERFVAGLYARLGFQAVRWHPALEFDLRGFSKGQIDMTYRDSNAGHSVYAEIKYHHHPSQHVSRKDVAYFIDVLQRHGQPAFCAEVITNTAFTKNARRLANEYAIRLTDGSLLDRYSSILRPMFINNSSTLNPK